MAETTLSRSDIILYKRGFSERWPMPAELCNAACAAMFEIVLDRTAPRKARIGAFLALLKADQNDFIRAKFAQDEALVEALEQQREQPPPLQAQTRPEVVRNRSCYGLPR